jgi:hypothetical protein
MRIISCRTCGQELTTVSGTQIYCSYDCRSNRAPGVYCFICFDGRCYVGSAGDVYTRARGIDRSNPWLDAATRYFTIDIDGLAQPWRGRVFCNPPYARGWIDRFVAKFLAEHQAKNMQQGLLLTNASTETKWWQAAGCQCDAICFLAGRVRS